MTAIEIAWDSEAKNYIIVNFKEDWTWEQFHAAVRQMHEMVRSVNYTVDMVMWHQAKFPQGNLLSNFRSAVRDQPKNTGQIIIVPLITRSPIISFMKTLANALEQIYPERSKILMVDSMDEAKLILIRRERR